jgi:hypothetical protein
MKSTTLALLGAAALPLVLGAYIGRPSAKPASRKLRAVTIVATDYRLEAPDTLPAGATTFRLVNQGKEFHHLWVARLEQGKTVADLLDALETHGPLPAWVRELGGPNAPAPGGEAIGTVALTPGSYVVACLIPSDDHIPHLAKGMIRPLTVVPADRPEAPPAADVTMTLHDYTFTLSRPLTAGLRTIEVSNEGAQAHEIELVQLAPGKSARDVLAWLHTPDGAPPGLPLGGVAPLSVQGVAWFEVDLAAGRYALICFLPDSKDRKPHFEHGMVQEIEVGAAMSAR